MKFKVLHVVNSISPTSIPLTWVELQKLHSDINPKIISAIKPLDLLGHVSECDLVHGHHVKSGLLAAIISKVLLRKFIFTTHGAYPCLSTTNKILIFFVYLLSDWVVFVNDELYTLLPSLYKRFVKKKKSIILNGVRIEHGYSKVDVRKKYGIPSNSEIVFHPSRLVWEKNQVRLVEAFSMSMRKNKNIVLVIAGAGALGNQLKDLVKRFGIEENVFFLGYISREDVYSFLGCCSLYIMPSLSEGLNVSFLEALTQRVKVVVSSIRQFTDTFQQWNVSPEHLRVLFCDPISVNSISSAIDLSLRNQDTITNVDLNFLSIDAMIDKYVDLYLSCVIKKQ